MQIPSPNRFREELKRFFTPSQLEKIGFYRIGIAGAGGLGSNVAMLLARSGMENFFILDRDNIEFSNLNRQHYWPTQVGMPKVQALEEHLLKLNANIRIESQIMDLNDCDLQLVLQNSDIWIEALDESLIKKRFVETALLAGKTVIASSGIGGYGGLPLIKKIIGRLTVIGDFHSDIDSHPPLAPKVTQAAAMMADRVLELILTDQGNLI